MNSPHECDLGTDLVALLVRAAQEMDGDLVNFLSHLVAHFDEEMRFLVVGGLAKLMDGELPPGGAFGSQFLKVDESGQTTMVDSSEAPPGIVFAAQLVAHPDDIIDNFERFRALSTNDWMMCLRALTDICGQILEPLRPEVVKFMQDQLVADARRN